MMHILGSWSLLLANAPVLSFDVFLLRFEFDTPHIDKEYYFGSASGPTFPFPFATVLA